MMCQDCPHPVIVTIRDNRDYIRVLLRSPSVLLGMEESNSQYLYLAHDVLILRNCLAHIRMGPGHVTLLNAHARIFQTAPFAGGVDAKDGYQHVFML